MDTSDVLEVLSIDLIGIIPEDETIITSTNRGKPVALDEKSPAGQAFGRIAQRLLGEDVPFAVFLESGNIFQRMFRSFRGSDGRGA